MKRWIVFLTMPLLGALVMMSAGICVWRSAEFPLQISGDASCLKDIEIQTELALREGQVLKLSLKQGKTSYELVAEEQTNEQEGFAPFAVKLDKDSIKGRRTLSEQERECYEQAAPVPAYFINGEAPKSSLRYIGSLTIQHMVLDEESDLYSRDLEEEEYRTILFEKDGKQAPLRQQIFSNDEWMLVEETRTYEDPAYLDERQTVTDIYYSIVSTDKENPEGYSLGELVTENYYLWSMHIDDKVILFSDEEKQQGYYIPTFLPMYEKENHLYFFDEESDPKVKEVAALNNERSYTRIMKHGEELLLMSQDEEHTYLTFYDKSCRQTKELSFQNSFPFSSLYDFAGSIYRNDDYLIWYEEDIYVVDLKKREIADVIERELIEDRTDEEEHGYSYTIDLYYKQDTLYVLEDMHNAKDLTIKVIKEGKQMCRAQWELQKIKKDVKQYSQLWFNGSVEVR